MRVPSRFALTVAAVCVMASACGAPRAGTAGVGADRGGRSIGMTGTDRTVPGSGAAWNAGISGSSSTSVANRSTSTAGARKVLLVVEENHTAAQVTAGMPYLTSLGNAFAKNTAVTGVSHPSLPNYLAIAFGDTFGYTSDGLPDQYGVHGRSVFGQALTAGRTAYVYAQSSPSSCYLRNAGAYVPRHVGWPYALDERRGVDGSPLAPARRGQDPWLPTYGPAGFPRWDGSSPTTITTPTRRRWPSPMRT